FVFGNTFGNDTIAGGASEDVIQFTNAFNAKEYSISQNNNDLVISYQQTGMDTTNSLTISDWFTSADHIDTVQFSNGSYSISENGFTKQSAGC
ncbi:MAG: calcium-binding protein, partial [Anaerovibrio sp.]|nr:calcium-binding protein [Anaerovibrio sp.]